MVAESSPARAPKQARSRESFERVIEATLELLYERNYDQITLADISRKAEVSTGSMYGRIDGKGSLLRVVQQRFYERLTEQTKALRQRIDQLPAHLHEVVPAVVEGLGSQLAQHAPVLRAIMLAADQDPEIAALGNRFGSAELVLFSELLKRCQHEVRHPEPERALGSAIQIVYAALARYLRLDTSGGPAQEEWEPLKADLSDMVLAFLLFEGLPRKRTAKAAPKPAPPAKASGKAKTRVGGARKTAPR